MRRTLSSIGFGLVGLFFLALSVSAWITAESWFVTLTLGPFTLLIGILSLIAAWAALTTPSPPETREATSSRPALNAVLEVHAAELGSVPSGERRAQLLRTWREHIDGRAPDWAEQVASHPDRDSVSHAEVQAIILSYYAGYAGGRGWLDSVFARAEAGAIGRKLRDAMRALDLNLDQMSPATGVVIDDALLQIVELGLGDAQQEYR